MCDILKQNMRDAPTGVTNNEGSDWLLDLQPRRLLVRRQSRRLLALSDLLLTFFTVDIKMTMMKCLHIFN